MARSMLLAIKTSSVAVRAILDRQKRWINDQLNQELAGAPLDAPQKTKSIQDYRQKIGPDKFDTFAAKYSWMDGGKYVSQAAPAAMFLQYPTYEPFLNGDLARQCFEIVSEPKKLKIYRRRMRLTSKPPALQAAGRQDRSCYSDLDRLARRATAE